MTEPAQHEPRPDAWVSPPSLAPDPEAMATVEQLRLSELQGIHQKLGRVCKAEAKHWWARLEWDRIFGTLAVLFGGACIGGGVALIPFLDTDPSHRTRIEYYVSLGVACVLAALCAIARLAIRFEQIESVTTIYGEVGDLVKRYEARVKNGERTQ